jgi:hypothetical protein
LFDPEPDEEHKVCEHRAEHAEDDARSDQMGAAKSMDDQPQSAGEDQAGTELTHEGIRSRRSASRLWPGITSAAEAASIVASGPSTISAGRRSTGSSTTAAIFGL